MLSASVDPHSSCKLHWRGASLLLHSMNRNITKKVVKWRESFFNAEGMNGMIEKESHLRKRFRNE